MNITSYLFALLVTCSLVFAGQAEAKHGSEQARSRVLKEISQRASHNPEYSITKKIL